MPAMNFLGKMGATFSITGYNFHSTFAGGWTSTRDGSRPAGGRLGRLRVVPDPRQLRLALEGRHGELADRRLAVAAVERRHHPADDHADGRRHARRRTAGTSPTRRSDLGGQRRRVGRVGAVGLRPAGPSPPTRRRRTLACTATSTGGTGQRVGRREAGRRRTTGHRARRRRPRSSIFTVRPRVVASVSDATSGPASPTAAGFADASTAGTFSSTITGVDRAGNRSRRRARTGSYIPTCGGRAPTILGTAGNDVIDGTNGPDVIVALGGADTVRGLGGNDRICGNGGDDAAVRRQPATTSPRRHRQRQPARRQRRRHLHQRRARVSSCER